MALTDEERAVVEFAGRWYRQAGTREQAIADEFGMTATRYAQLLNQLIDDPGAALEYPQIVARLRRQRDRVLRQKLGPLRGVSAADPA